MRLGAILIFTAMLALLSGAAEEKVYVVLLHYDSEGFTVREVQVKDGYAPDRKMQQGSLKAELISEQSKVIYGFNFEVPLLLFTDTAQGGKMKGSVIKLNETDFVLVVPFHEKASLRIQDGETSYVTPLSPESLTRRLVRMGLWLAAGGVLFIGYMFVRKRFNEEEPPNTGRQENPYQMPPGQY
ncbi:hypothetical protein HYV81_05950 [Candidatus Woesearchaeota archaeon]|nr:hypothetical protein [Candidatus Woesearchaeota archaeon]